MKEKHRLEKIKKKELKRSADRKRTDNISSSADNCEDEISEREECFQ